MKIYYSKITLKLNGMTSNYIIRLKFKYYNIEQLSCKLSNPLIAAPELVTFIINSGNIIESDTKANIITSRVTTSKHKTHNPHEIVGTAPRDRRNHKRNEEDDGLKENFWQGLNNDSLDNQDYQDSAKI